MTAELQSGKKEVTLSKKPDSREVMPTPWPLGMAVRRLKEAADEIAVLEGLHHREIKFQVWLQNLSEILRRNWPDERLPHFSESRIRLRGEPSVTGRDVAIYREGLAKTRAQIERILRNERELAEAKADVSVLEIFLAPGTQHQAYQEIRQIISSAAQELIIVDNYVDGTLFQLLTNVNQTVTIKILTFSMPADFALEGKKFAQQYGHIVEVKKDRDEFHDRFIILDNARVFHLGHSIKDAGKKAMMIHQLEDNRNIIASIQTFETVWGRANSIPL
jgi:hypothetical protein